MEKKSRILSFAMILLLLALIFGAIEWRLSQEYESPAKAIARRHILEPVLAVENKIYGEFHGSAEIPVLLKGEARQFRDLRGIRFKSGSYGKRVEASVLKVFGLDGREICRTHGQFTIAENLWTSVLLACDQSENNIFQPKSIRIELAGDDLWAIYQAGAGVPALQFWFDDATPRGSFIEARNYGGLWQPSILSVLRMLTRLLLALGLTGVLFGRLAKPSTILMGSCLWFGLFWGQLFETVTYQSPDEPAHAVGAYRSITPTDAWPAQLEALKTLGGKVQFRETFVKADAAIVPGHDGVPWVSDDNFFVNPENRSGLYALIARPLARFSLFSAEKFGGICQDPVACLRIFLSVVITLLGLLSLWFFRKERRPISAWCFLLVCCLPGILASYLTIWNYGILTILGVLFAVCLIPEGSSKSKRRALLVASLLVPILGEFARSQVVWFAVGPFAVMAAAVYNSSEEKSLATRIKNLSRFMLVSLGTFLGLAITLQEAFIPDRVAIITMVSMVVSKLSAWFHVQVDFFMDNPIVSLGIIFVFSWLLSMALLLAFDLLLKSFGRALSPKVATILRVLACGAVTAALIVIVHKCRSLADPLFVRSLASLSPYPTFVEHLRESYRALMSQTFIRQQDYFLVQTFFMAYGWLEVTGHWLIYVLYRLLLTFGLVAFLITSFVRPKIFLQLLAPLVIAFSIFMLVVWYGAWSAQFTIVGRFVFPGIAILYVSLLMAAAASLNPTKEQIPLGRKEELGIKVLLLYIVINSVYGAFYLLPHRFVVGL